MRTFVLSIFLLALVTACDSQEQASTSTESIASISEKSTSTPEAASADEIKAETQRLNDWFEARYEEELAFSPITLTMLGRKERYSEMDDASEEAADKQLAWKAQTVADMKANFDYDRLDQEAKTSWDLWEYQYQQELKGKEFRKQSYVFHQMGGVHSFIPNFLINFHKVESLEDMQAYHSRISAAARIIDQLIVHAENGAKAGVHAPRFAYDIVSEEVAKIVDNAPFVESDEDSALWADAKSKISLLQEQELIDSEGVEQLTMEIKGALLDSLAPAYRRLLAFLEQDYDNTKKIAEGVAGLPSGKDFYNYRLQAMTTTDMTADEVHELGLSEVARLRSEMEAVKTLAGFEGTLEEFFVFQRESKTDPRLYFQNPETGAQEYIDEADAAIKNIKTELGNYFGILPKADLIVKRVESFREQDGAAQHYYPGTPDGSRPGTYYAHLSDMGAMPRNQLEVIAYHEGLPGHHMQISIAQELEGIPTFRTQANATAYTEGWALYAELLAKEIPGTYKDPYSEFGRLASEMFRAIRLVVDTGMHAKGWSQQQAIDYFAENSPEPLTGIESEVMRYLVIPGQATSYKVGMLDILRLRKEAETALGEKFDLKGFHDAVLSGGALPLKLLDRRINNWISSQQG